MLLTCVTIDTTEQHNPPKNAVINIVRTDPANTVNIQDNEKGADIIVNNRLRPYLRKNPPINAPNNAPSIDKLAIQLASWSEIVRVV